MVVAACCKNSPIQLNPQKFQRQQFDRHKVVFYTNKVILNKLLAQILAYLGVQYVLKKQKTLEKWTSEGMPGLLSTADEQ